MPPQFGRAAAQLLVASFEVVEIESQYGSPVSFRLKAEAAAIRLKPDSTKEEKREHDDRHRDVRHDVADRGIHRPAGEEARLLHQADLEVGLYRCSPALSGMHR